MLALQPLPVNEDEPYRAFLAAFQLDRFDSGWHIVRDHRGWRVRDIQVCSLWLASIQPSFDSHAFLFVVHTPDGASGLFAFAGSDGLPIIVSEPVAVRDSVSEALSSINLSPTSSDFAEISLDGISHSLHVRALSLSYDLHFSNPSSKCLRRIQRELVATAESLRDRRISDYLQVWRRYLSE